MKANLPETGQERIVIIGAGFAGLEFAKKMAKSKYQVVLIDKNNYHQFQPLFYQVATAGLEPSSISFPLRKLFRNNKNVFVRITTVEQILTEEKKILTELGEINYDHLVLAMGADTNYYGNKTLQEKTLPMKSVSEALYLRNTIFEDFEKSISEENYEKRQGYIDIVIVGGGPTGVELAGALADMRSHILPKDYPELNCKEIDIYLIQSAPILLKGMSEESSKESERFLEDMGVIVKTNTRVTDYDGEFVYMNNGDKIRSKKVIWAAGIKANGIDGLPQDCYTYGNRIKVDSYNKIENLSDVYAIGDVCYMETEQAPQGHPQVAQVAIQQGDNLAANFKRKLKNITLESFVYKDLGSMATIGRNKAVVDLPRFKFQGFFAWMVWLIVHLLAIIGAKNKLFIFLNWVWNYITYDQSLRLIIKPSGKRRQEKIS